MPTDAEWAKYGERLKAAGFGGGTAAATAPAPAPAPAPSVNWDGGSYSSEDSGPSASELAYQAQQAAEAAAKKAAKDKSNAENAATNAVVDSLVQSLANYGQGRDQAKANAQTNFDTALSGILSQYRAALGDVMLFKQRNESDYDTKSVANTTNMVRESNDLLAQVLSQGAGETDSLRALQQATRGADANQLELAASFSDTLRTIGSQLTNANSNTERGRLDAFGQKAEANAQAENEYNKNMADTWTNIQRAEAGNTNIESDYSSAFQNRYGSDDAVKANDEIAKYTGKVAVAEKPGAGWSATWDGKKDEVEGNARLGNRAAALSVGPLRRAEGATLRKW
jgi:hypothetical protein